MTQGRQRARLDRDRDDRPRPQRRDARHRRPVRRAEGVARRLLRLRVRLDRRGVHVGGEDPGRAARRDRGAARLRRREVRRVVKYAALLTNNADDIAAWEKMTPGGGGRRRAPRRSRSGRRSSTSSARPASLGFGAELDSPTTAKTVRVRDGETIVTDGPFAETKEQIGGLMVLDGDDLDAGDRDRGADPGRLPRLRRAEAGHRALTDRRARVFREEWGRAVAILTRVLGDLELAEDAVQDAFATALERWPRDGTPANPGAWIVTTARNRAIDRLRREQTFARKAELLARLEALPGRGGRRELDPRRPARARLHLLPPGARAEARVALTLREVGGLTTTRDRARLPRRRAGDGAAARAREAEDPRRRASRSASRPTTCCPSGCARCSPCSTSSSTRATRRAAATSSSAPSSATRRSGSRSCSPC